MPDISPQTDGPIYADDEAPPSWQDLRDDGAMLIDDSNQKLAVYPGNLGAVVLASQEHNDPVPRFIVLDHGLIPELVAKLTKVQAEAAATSADWEAKYDAVEALEQEGGA